MKGRDFWIRLIVLQILFSFSDMFSDLSTGRLWGNLPTNMFLRYSNLIDQKQIVDCKRGTFDVFCLRCSAKNYQEQSNVKMDKCALLV